MIKLDYESIVALNLARKDLDPGDTILVALRNEDAGIFQQAMRVYRLFTTSLAFFPQHIAIHPDHLAMLKKQGKTVDILIDEKMAEILKDMVDLSTIPRRIPFVGDDNLDLFTVVARYEFSKEQVSKMSQHLLEGFLKGWK